MTAWSVMHDPAWWTPERRAATGERLAAYHRERSPLTWEDVREIRRLGKTALKLDAIAARYPVSIVTVACILRNEVWHDPAYTPGLQRACPECATVFVTQRSNKRFCSSGCRGTFNTRRARGHQRRGSKPKYRRPTEVRLETPTAFGHAMGDLVIADPHAVDPHAALEQATVLELLDGVDVDALDDHQRRALQRRLAAAGFVPSVQR